MTITAEPFDRFACASWLRGPHLQTIWGRIGRPRRLVVFEREVLATPDGDELILDHVSGQGSGARVLFLHGLEGSSYSVYVQGMLRILQRHGIAATVMNFRSCARDPRNIRRSIPNRGARLYHSGETSDFDFVLRTLAARFPHETRGAIGVSIGANVLLKWLGENRAQPLLASAVAVSTPFDLDAGARHLEKGMGRLYAGSFISSLKKKATAVSARHALARERIDLPRALRAKTFYEYDDAATAPLHGFDGAADYYARSSSIGFVGRIETPTLCISAADDPFLPRAVLDRVRAAASPAVTLVTTEEGGHTGFVAGTAPWDCRYWAEERAVEWVTSLIVDR
ncbi:MAG TPA: alpha/beta fold hydrolase [Thermoanaerobaculia bacterium]|nr:alpha/beta fold hydrolase [Thermoanaerobaculia bacterium]